MEEWMVTVLTAASTSPPVAERGGYVVDFVVDGRSHPVVVPAGRISGDSHGSDCRLEADESVLKTLVAGRYGLQYAHASGRVKLTGDPNALLALAVLFDATARISKM